MVLAFDVYGTLIDTAGVVSRLRPLIGADAESFSRLWREKQLEYSFRRGLMERYQDFAVCTREALRYTSASLKLTLTPEQEHALLAAYRELPAFDDVVPCLARLRDDGFSPYAFSNGTEDAVDTLLTSAGIREYFLDVVSVDELETFKPNPAVYRHFLTRTGAKGDEAWLISGNPFDVIGAMAVGMRGAWVRRSADAVFDPWGAEPTLTVPGLLDLGDGIAAHGAASTKPNVLREPGNP